jgi:hypothetical protein
MELHVCQHLPAAMSRLVYVIEAVPNAIISLTSSSVPQDTDDADANADDNCRAHWQLGKTGTRMSTRP